MSGVEASAGVLCQFLRARHVMHYYNHTELDQPVKVRFTHAINFRESDKSLLDDAIAVSKEESINFTNLARRAIAEYVGARKKRKASGENGKLEDYLNGLSSGKTGSYPSIDYLLTPQELANWSDEDLWRLARQLKGRREEVESALRKRGFFVQW